MTEDRLEIIDVRQLGEGLPAITPAFGFALVEAIAICLQDQNHGSGHEFLIEGDFQTQVRFTYPTVTEQMQRCWNDE